MKQADERSISWRLRRFRTLISPISVMPRVHQSWTVAAKAKFPGKDWFFRQGSSSANP